VNYDEAVAWLYSTQEVGIKLGLESFRRVVEALGLESWLAGEPPPGAAMRRRVIFHIAGTNGKGSVCALLDALCREAGYRTGLFTSPHLITYRERVRLDGVMIPETEVARLLHRIRSVTETKGLKPTFFEITTALALLWFEEQEAEMVVLETGLGGRLDATNVVRPTVSVLTPISLDHHQYLGNTLEAVAGEKAGIIKHRRPVLSARQPKSAAKVIAEKSHIMAAPLAWALEPVEEEVALAGSHQKLNASLALAALGAAEVTLADEVVRAGLKRVSWPGRFQRIAKPGRPEWIIDGAHNEAAAERLVATWHEVFGEEKPVVILGALADKKVEEICRKFAPLSPDFVVAPVRNHRSCTPKALAAILLEVAPQVNCTICETLEAALEWADAKAAAEGRRVLVTGSFFLVGQVLALSEGTSLEEVSSQ